MAVPSASVTKLSRPTSTPISVNTTESVPIRQTKREAYKQGSIQTGRNRAFRCRLKATVPCGPYLWPGYTSSLFELVGFLAALIASYISDRVMNGRRLPDGSDHALPAGGMVLIHPVIGRLDPGAMALSISVLGILIYGPDLLMSGPASVDAVPAGHATRAAGIVNGVGSLRQHVVAVVVSRFGSDQLFTFFLMFAVMAGSLLTLRWNKGKDWK